MTTKTKKEKPYVKKVEKTLSLRADKVRQRVRDSGLKQGFIAEKIHVAEPSLSRFMNNDPQYTTERIVSSLEGLLTE
jgi:predicted XRE-type DNA-binding protein